MMPMLPAMLVTAVRPFLVSRLRPESRKAVQKDMLVFSRFLRSARRARRFSAAVAPAAPSLPAAPSSAYPSSASKGAESPTICPSFSSTMRDA